MFGEGPKHGGKGFLWGIGIATVGALFTHAALGGSAMFASDVTNKPLYDWIINKPSKLVYEGLTWVFGGGASSLISGTGIIPTGAPSALSESIAPVRNALGMGTGLAFIDSVPALGMG